MQVELEGRIALVTGAAQGIGQAIADTLVRNGARVVYTDLKAASAQAAAVAAVPIPRVHDVKESVHVPAAHGSQRWLPFRYIGCTM